MSIAEPRRILIIDDEDSMRHMLRLVLEKEGYQVTEAADGLAGLELLKQNGHPVVLCDIRMPGLDGLSFLRQAARLAPGVQLIMMSAYGTVDTAIQCMKEGAYDYIAKPFKTDEVILTLRKAEERQRLIRENTRLLRELKGRERPAEIIGRSAAMTQVLTLVGTVADSRSPVLITGETGTGKELVARALHAGSGRRSGPFVAVNCSAIAAGLLESELFGHVKGAFTGADRERAGLFAAADGGTLFLDEVGELPLELQPKLLRVIQEGEVRRVGENRASRVDVRILSATARDLKEEATQGRFRDDLYYRLAVVEIRIPSLSERREDIPELARHFVALIAAREGRSTPLLAPDALETLQGYDWPGNVRELENFMEKTMIFCRGEVISRAALPWEVRRRPRDADAADPTLRLAVRRIETECIRKALAATGGNRTQAARRLDISLRGLLYKMKDYGVE